MGDWIGGRIMRALPTRLCVKLLSYLLDNKEMNRTMDFRENGNEFTLLLYKNEQQKIQAKNGEVDKIFDEKKLTEDGLGFYASEMVVDESQTVRLLPTAVDRQMQSKLKTNIRALGRKNRLLESQSNGLNSDTSDTENNSIVNDQLGDISNLGEDEILVITKPYKRKKWNNPEPKPKKPPAQRKYKKFNCQHCGKLMRQDNRRRHWKSAHSDWYY